ncbi:MAG TPA: hypothetical protein VJY42_01415 [Candidatus Methanomethylophilaceae archaeon]|nr:hypothetical protein [Candidatus Methanomethylophilaceae archaeon]
MEADAIIASIKDHSPEVILILSGIVAILIVFLYLKDDRSLMYKFVMFLGLISGVAMIYIAAVEWNGLALSTAIIVAVGGFALLIRPFREVHFAVLLALFVMIITYIMLGELNGSVVYGMDVSFLAIGWPRIIISVVLGAITFMITNFAEAIIKLFGKLLNWWPFLFILGILCVVEGVSVYLGYGSVYEIYLAYTA